MQVKSDDSLNYSGDGDGDGKVMTAECTFEQEKSKEFYDWLEVWERKLDKEHDSKSLVIADWEHVQQLTKKSSQKSGFSAGAGKFRHVFEMPGEH